MVYVGISSALCMIRLSLSYGTGEDAATQTLPTETFAKLGIATDLVILQIQSGV